MTAVEFQNNVELELRKYANYEDYFLTSADIEYYSNQAQNIIFEQYYSEFEQNESNRFGLNELIAVSALDATTYKADGLHTNGEYWTMPSGLYYIIKESITDSDSNYIPVKPVTYDYYNANINNPFKKPSSSLIWRLEGTPDGSDKRKELITNGNITTSTYTLHYISKPTTIDIDDDTTIDFGFRATKELIYKTVELIQRSIKNGQILKEQPRDGQN